MALCRQEGGTFSEQAVANATQNMTETAKTSLLPNYESPPVIEVVVGLQFAPIAKFSNAHLGAFWQYLGPSEWPSVADASVLPLQKETFGNVSNWGRPLRLKLSQDPASRIQIRNRAGNRMVQLQNGQILLNWIGLEGDNYPRFAQVYGEFTGIVERFRAFAQENDLGSLQFDQWEVTYVNKIPQTIWRTPSDWDFFLPLNGLPTIPGLIEPESFSGEWHFVIPDQKGRLHIQWLHATDSETSEVSHIQLMLTARGPVQQDGDLTVNAHRGIELGHQAIVRSFRFMMNDTANAEWKLRDVVDN